MYVRLLDGRVEEVSEKRQCVPRLRREIIERGRDCRPARESVSDLRCTRPHVDRRVGGEGYGTVTTVQIEKAAARIAPPQCLLHLHTEPGRHGGGDKQPVTGDVEGGVVARRVIHPSRQQYVALMDP